MRENQATTASSSEKLAALFYRAFTFMARAHHHQGHAEHAQMRLLALFSNRNSISQRELLETLQVRSASLSEILDKLEHRGLIRRERDEQDKRAVVVTVTGQGSAVAATGEGVRRKSADALFASLSGEERRRLAELLDKVVRAWEKDTSGYAQHPDPGTGRPRGRHGYGDPGRGCRASGNGAVCGHGHPVPGKGDGPHGGG